MKDRLMSFSEIESYMPLKEHADKTIILWNLRKVKAWGLEAEDS
jgi:hypothetical protein